MADDNKTTFGGFAKRRTTPAEPKTMKVVRKSQKTGRPGDFTGQETTRIAVKLPIETVKTMRREMIDSDFPTQNQFVNEAILYYIQSLKEE